MDLMTLILSCAFHTLNDDVIQSIALIESNALNHYVRPSGALNGVEYRNKDLALGAIQRLVDTRQGAFVGLMGVPIEAAAKYDIAPVELLNPCTNITVATAILREMEDRCEADGAKESFTCALDKYAVLTEMSPETFIETVLYGAIKTPDKDGVLPTHDDAIGDRIFWETNSHEGASNRLFFDIDIGQKGGGSGVKTARDLE